MGIHQRVIVSTIVDALGCWDVRTKWGVVRDIGVTIDEETTIGEDEATKEGPHDT